MEIEEYKKEIARLKRERTNALNKASKYKRMYECVVASMVKGDYVPVQYIGDRRKDIERVKDILSEYFGYDLRNKKLFSVREHGLAIARGVAMWYFYNKLSMNYRECGAEFMKDHATALHQCRLIDSCIESKFKGDFENRVIYAIKLLENERDSEQTGKELQDNSSILSAV